MTQDEVATKKELALPAEDYAVRPARDGEQGAIAALVRTTGSEKEVPPTMSEEDVRDEWRLPGFDPELDTWLITRGETVVGYAHLWRIPGRAKVTGWGAVHPDHRGRGLGRYLIEAVEERAREHLRADGLDEIEVHTGIVLGDAAAQNLLERIGYRLVRRFHEMAISLDGPLPEPPVLPGIRLRTIDLERDARAAHAVLDSAFSDHWNHVELSFEDWWAALDGGSSIDPELWLLAETDGEVAAVLAGSARGGEGWVDDLGVLRAHRRKGIGEFLLRSSFASFKERGIETVRLNVDSDSTTRATALYERAGMSVVAGFDVYEKLIPAGAAQT